MTFDNFAEDKISADYLVDTAHCCTMYIVKYRRWEGVIIGRVSIPTLPFIEGVQEVGGGNNRQSFHPNSAVHRRGTGGGRG